MSSKLDIEIKKCLELLFKNSIDDAAIRLDKLYRLAFVEDRLADCGYQICKKSLASAPLDQQVMIDALDLCQLSELEMCRLILEGLLSGVIEPLRAVVRLADFFPGHALPVAERSVVEEAYFIQHECRDGFMSSTDQLLSLARVAIKLNLDSL